MNSHREAKNRWCGGRVCGGRGMATGTGLFMKPVTSWVWYDQMGDKPQLLIPSRAAPLGIAKLSPARMLSRVRLFVTSWTVPAKLLCPRGFSRQDYWSRVAMLSFRESSWSSDWTRVSSVSRTGRRGSLPLAPLGKPQNSHLGGRKGENECMWKGLHTLMDGVTFWTLTA